MSSITNSYTNRMLPKWAQPAILVGSCLISLVAFFILAAGNLDAMNWTALVIIAVIIYFIGILTISRVIEGARKSKDRVASALITSAFILALLPLISVIITVLERGLNRFDLSFFLDTMRGVTDAGGGALHAIMGTLMITLWATAISVPIGLLTAIYLVEYGRGKLAKWITFFVDVMTGIPSIVAGLFAYSMFAMLFGPGVRLGIAGSVALSVLMIPVVVRSSEEILRLVPNELREASYALGVPKWLTILKVVLPSSLAGIVTGGMIAISRIIGETAPLLLVAGFTTSMNLNMFKDRVMTLPVYVYDQYKNQGLDSIAYENRAWTGALVLIMIVMLLNLGGRVIAKIFSPKLS